MAAEIEFYAGTVWPGDLQAVVRRVVGAGVGIAHDHDAGGDEASRIVRGVVQRRQHAREIEALGVHDLLRRGLFDQDGRLRIAECAPDQVANAAEIRAERSLAIGLTRQQVADDRHVMADDVAEQQRRAAVELLHHAGNLEMRIGRRAIGLQPAALRHAFECSFPTRAAPKWCRAF